MPFRLVKWPLLLVSGQGAQWYRAAPKKGNRPTKTRQPYNNGAPGAARGAQKN